MKIEWTALAPGIGRNNTLQIHAVLRHGFIEKISVRSSGNPPERFNLSQLPDLNENDPFIIFSFYKMLIGSRVIHISSDKYHSSCLFQLKILQDYFVILEIMKQIKILAVTYDDKALFQTTGLFFRENAFNQKILSRLASLIRGDDSKTAHSILSLRDVFFLYDLIMGYEKAKEKEGKFYLTVNNFLFKHINKEIKIIKCDFYRDDFMNRDGLITVTLPEYREYLLHDLKKCLQALKTDLEQLSKNEDELSFRTLNPSSQDLPGEPETSFYFGKMIRHDNEEIDLEYLYDRLFKHPEFFIGLHYESFEFFLILINFRIQEKVLQ